LGGYGRVMISVGIRANDVPRWSFNVDKISSQLI
jgi:hypothetical protein